jgi:uncharacterized membrane protein
MDALWRTLAALIECVGALIIVAHAMRALGIVLRERQTIDRAKRMIAEGAITGLDCTLAATLLTTMTLLTWHQIGMFAALYALRFLLKQAFRREQQAATPRARPI